MDLASLWSRCRAGEQDARRALIETYAELAASIARRMRVPTGALAGRDDLESAALLGLIQAIDRFEPDRGVPFEAFAALRIRGAILDELRLVDDRSRGERRQVREDDAPAPRLTFSLEELVEAGATQLWIADDVRAANEDEADLRARVERALHRIPARQRELLGRYYGEALTLREAGMKMGISEARACQIHGRAIENLRRILMDAGLGATAAA